MSAFEAQKPLGWFEVLRAQVVVVALSRHKRVAIFLAFVLAQVLALAGFGVILGLTVTTENDVTQVGMTSIGEIQEEFDLEAPRAVASLGVAFVMLCGFAVFWPFGLWSGERPSERGYHWSLPVGHRSHDLARVVAGAIVLVGAAVGAYAISTLISVVTGTAEGLGSMPLAFWGGLVLGPLIPYAWTSIFTVRCEHPAGWFWGTLGAVALTSSAAGALGIGAVNRALYGLMASPIGLFRATAGSVWAGYAEELDGALSTGISWWGVWGLWFALLASAVWLASSRRAPG